MAAGDLGGMKEGGGEGLKAAADQRWVGRVRQGGEIKCEPYHGRYGRLHP